MSGFAPTGTIPLGAGIGAGGLPESIIHAVAIAQNRILVQFPIPVSQTDPLGDIDGINPENYAISVDGLDNPSVVSVRPTDRPDEVELVLSVPMQSGYEYQVTASNCVVSPSSATCDGPTRSRVRGEDRTGRDLKSQLTSGTPGSVQADGRGDYDLSTRRETLRKRIYRILIVNPGSLTAHPDFGVGIEQYKSRKIKDDLLLDISGAIERQLTAEPDIKTVTSTFRTEKSGSMTILIIKIGITCTDGFSDDFEYKFDWEAT